jgi:hypothetical protein
MPVTTLPGGTIVGETQGLQLVVSSWCVLSSRFIALLDAVEVAELELDADAVGRRLEASGLPNAGRPSLPRMHVPIAPSDDDDFMNEEFLFLNKRILRSSDEPGLEEPGSEKNENSSRGSRPCRWLCSSSRLF